MIVPSNSDSNWLRQEDSTRGSTKGDSRGSSEKDSSRGSSKGDSRQGQVRKSPERVEQRRLQRFKWKRLQ